VNDEDVRAVVALCDQVDQLKRDLRRAVARAESAERGEAIALARLEATIDDWVRNDAALDRVEALLAYHQHDGHWPYLVRKALDDI
jgi:hypothetical protein